MPIPLRLASDSPGIERRLRERLAAAPGARTPVLHAVAEAFVDGVVALARLDASAREAHLAACAAVAVEQPLDRDALRRWHQALGGSGAWRSAVVEGAAPPEFVDGRVDLLVDWLGADGGRELPPAAAGALVLARLLEIEPFDTFNTSVALLAARHVMCRTGGLGPVLRESDREALRAAVPAAQAFETRPLADVLDQAAERALEVAVAALERHS